MDTQENWKNVSLLVCVFAMIREIRPIKPFITSYLKSMNFTLNQVFILNIVAIKVKYLTRIY